MKVARSEQVVLDDASVHLVAGAAVTPARSALGLRVLDAGNNGATGFVRVDWLTPTGLSTWGDGRSFILGTTGYIELRKYVNIATDDGPGSVFLVNDDGERRIDATGEVGYPFFGELILDCLNRTENAMTQDHAFKAAELGLRAQAQATELTGRSEPQRIARWGSDE